MQTYFNQLATDLHTHTTSDEVFLATLSAEQSNFVRFNKNKVRQAGSVKQVLLTISLIKNQRRAERTLTLVGDAFLDLPQCAATLDTLRQILSALPEDPYLIYNTVPASSRKVGESALPSDADMLDEIIANGQGRDLVGIFASGTIYKGFANSLGQRNWHQVDNFNFDWCLYHAADKAVKNSYAGTHWDSAELRHKMQSPITQLNMLARLPKR